MSRANLQGTRVADLLVVSLVLRTEWAYSFFRGALGCVYEKWVGGRWKGGLANRNKMKRREKKMELEKKNITEGGRKCT